MKFEVDTKGPKHLTDLRSLSGDLRKWSIRRCYSKASRKLHGIVRVGSYKVRI